MGRIIGVLNYKGGTGKTTTVINLGAGLALRGERVLCVDLDAQGSLAISLGVKFTRTLVDLLNQGATPSD
jgi:chromosome partitioning protein